MTRAQTECGCEWETGTWFPCARHMTPHAAHAPHDPAPGCTECQRIDPYTGSVAQADGDDGRRAA